MAEEPDWNAINARFEEWVKIPRNKEIYERLILLEEKLKIHQIEADALAEEFREHITEGSDEPRELYEKIGRFITRFSHLEEIIRITLFVRTGTNFDYMAIMTSGIDFRSLVSMTSVVWEKHYVESKKSQSRVRKIFNKIALINDDRNRIVHGLWVFRSNEFGARHTSRAAKVTQTHFSDESDIDRLLRDLDEAETNLTALWAGRFAPDVLDDL